LIFNEVVLDNFWLGGYAEDYDEHINEMSLPFKINVVFDTTIGGDQYFSRSVFESVEIWEEYFSYFDIEVYQHNDNNIREADFTVNVVGTYASMDATGRTTINGDIDAGELPYDVDDWWDEVTILINMSAGDGYSINFSVVEDYMREHLVIHEMGHALKLQHPSTPRGGFQFDIYEQYLPLSVMNYPNTPENIETQWTLLPSSHDIANLYRKWVFNQNSNLHWSNY
jgi:hypothetical protein